MQNVMLAYPNRAQAATLTGGSWQAPLVNMQTGLLSEVARSTSLSASHTKFNIALDTDRKVMLVALCRHSLSSPANYRVKAGSSAGASDLYDSGWLPVWPDTYPYETLDWEDNTWWTGQADDEEIAAYPSNLIHLLPGYVFTRFWTVELSDPTNSAGYVEIGRLFVSDRWQPAVNFSWGATLGVEDATTVEESDSGVEFFRQGVRRRVARLGLDWLSQNEALTNALGLQRKAGVSGEVFLLWQPDDVVHRMRHSFLGRLRNLSAIEFASVAQSRAAFEIREIV